MIRICPSCGRKNRIPAAHLADTGRCGACKAALPPVSEPVDVDASQFDDIIANAPVPVVVDFWAAWCGPCRVAAPAVARLAGDSAGRAIVLKVDTDRHPALASRYAIRGIPSFLVFQGGDVVHRQAGVVDHRQMLQWVERAAG